MSAGADVSALAAIASFVIDAVPPDEARRRAGAAFLDTIGVMLAGSTEPVSRAVQRVVDQEGGGACVVAGTAIGASPGHAALANGTAAHALDYDDMCFVTLAHPSAPLVPAVLAAGEMANASGRAALEAYVVGFEVEARLGRLMNPRHYERGWHCTSTLGTLGAAAAVSRLLDLGPVATAHALGIAASTASGLKANFGTMVKPLHAGLAARNGVLAAQLAHAGVEASAAAIDGPQGLLRAMDSEGADLASAVADLSTRWEILDTGITVKLYPSCAATHPTLDTVLDLRREHAIDPEEVVGVDVEVDAITPTVLIHDRPANGLEAKFSMPFCVAAALVLGGVGIETFEKSALSDPRVAALMPRVAMRVDEALGVGVPALTQSRVRIQLGDGRRLARAAHGARGYPERPPDDREMAGKFLSCGSRAIPAARAAQALAALGAIDQFGEVRDLTALLAGSATARARASRS
jgi:2-methylcitrate dehydratase PrpD